MHGRGLGRFETWHYVLYDEHDEFLWQRAELGRARYEAEVSGHHVVAELKNGLEQLGRLARLLEHVDNVASTQHHAQIEQAHAFELDKIHQVRRAHQVQEHVVRHVVANTARVQVFDELPKDRVAHVLNVDRSVGAVVGGERLAERERRASGCSFALVSTVSAEHGAKVLAASDQDIAVSRYYVSIYLEIDIGEQIVAYQRAQLTAEERACRRR